MKKNNLSKLLKLSSELRNKGFNKYADELEYKFLILKKSETNLYSVFKETGDSLLSDVHPEGSVNLFDGDKDLNEVEDLLDQKKKIMKVVEKNPTGKLASAAAIIKAADVRGEAESFFSGILGRALGKLTRNVARWAESHTSQLMHDFESIFRGYKVSGNPAASFFENIIKKGPTQNPEVARAFAAFEDAIQSKDAGAVTGKARELSTTIRRVSGFADDDAALAKMDQRIDEMVDKVLSDQFSHKITDMHNALNKFSDQVVGSNPSSADIAIKAMTERIDSEIKIAQDAGNQVLVDALNSLKIDHLRQLRIKAAKKIGSEISESTVLPRVLDREKWLKIKELAKQMKADGDDGSSEAMLKFISEMKDVDYKSYNTFLSSVYATIPLWVPFSGWLGYKYLTPSSDSKDSGSKSTQPGDATEDQYKQLNNLLKDSKVLSNQYWKTYPNAKSEFEEDIRNRNFDSQTAQSWINKLESFKK